MDIKEEDTIEIDPEMIEQQNEQLKKMQSWNPCGGNPQDYNNPTVGVAVSAAATTIIAAGIPLLYTGNYEKGLIIVLAGIGVYIVKGILMKKNCL